MSQKYDNISQLADDYVLGVLEPSDREWVENHRIRNEELKAAIAASTERFLPLDTSIQPVIVSDTLWQKIETQLSKDIPVASSARFVSANDNKAATGWRLAALSSVAASLVLAIGLGWSLTRSVEPLVVAVLLNETGQVQAVVEDFGNEYARVRLLNDFAVPTDKIIQVWTLPSQDLGPVSLGLLEGVHSAQLRGHDLPQPKAEQLYELTLEPSGGSPTGRPTGPILAKGFAKTPL